MAKFETTTSSKKMRLKDKARHKDAIIRYCIENSHSTVGSISKNLSIDYDVAHSMIQELLDQDLLKLNGNISSKDSFTKNDMSVLINPKGRYFLNHEGGSQMLHKRYRQRQIWMTAKTIAAVANAIIIVYISIWGILKANDTKQFENRVDMLDSTITIQNLEINNLKNDILAIKRDSIK